MSGVINDKWHSVYYWVMFIASYMSQVWLGCFYVGCVAGRCLLLYSGLTQGQGHTVRQMLSFFKVFLCSFNHWVSIFCYRKNIISYQLYFYIYVVQPRHRLSWYLIWLNYGTVASMQAHEGGTPKASIEFSICASRVGAPMWNGMFYGDSHINF